MTESVLGEWYQEMESYLYQVNLMNIHPSRVYNLDESAFFLVPTGDKVLARRGCKTVYKVTTGDERESLTVLFTVNAGGTMLPPLILFWYERIPSSIMNSLPTDKERILGVRLRSFRFFRYVIEDRKIRNTCFFIFSRFHIWGVKTAFKVRVEKSFLWNNSRTIRDRGIVSIDEFCVFECEI